MYVLVEGSSSKAFTLIARLPFLRVRGTVRRARKPVCVPSAVVVVCDLSAYLSPGSRGGKRTNDTFSFSGFVSLLVFDMSWAASFLSVVGPVSTGCLWSAANVYVIVFAVVYSTHPSSDTRLTAVISSQAAKTQFQAFRSILSFLNGQIFEFVTMPNSVMSFAHFAGAIFLNFRFLSIPKECLLALITS